MRRPRSFWGVLIRRWRFARSRFGESCRMVVSSLSTESRSLKLKVRKLSTVIDCIALVEGCLGSDRKSITQ